MAKHYNKGFTLIEVMFSITLLAVIALFILPMSIYGVQFAKWNNIKLTAMNLAYSQVEWLRAEAAKDYDKLGLDLPGYSPKGIIKEDLYMNEKLTNPKTIGGIEYRLLTNIYWENAGSTTGDFVANATKKVDVIVKAKDPITGVIKTYSVMGSLIAFEGERTPTDNVPLKIRTITGEDFSEPAKNVKVVVNLGNSMAFWGRTDDEGKVFFSELSKNIEYNVFPSEWGKSKFMMIRPNSSSGISPNEKWDYIKPIKIVNDTVELIFFVDYPGYIILDNYDGIMNDTIVLLNPINYVSPEGETWDLDINTSLTNLANRMIWRAWEYEYSITRTIDANYTDKYYFVEKATGDMWNGKFQYKKDDITNLELELAFGLKDGCFTDNGDGTITAGIEFTSQMQDIEDLSFIVFEDANKINQDVISIIEVAAGRKYNITFSTTSNITKDKLKFVIDNPSLETLTSIHGMKIVKDLGVCELMRK